MPNHRQHAVKGTRVMMDAPFMRKSKETRETGLPGISWECARTPKEFPGSDPREFFESPRSSLASLEAAAGMEEAGPALMPAPPCRPGENQGDAGGRGKEQASQQAACFRDREGAQIGGHDDYCWVVPHRQQRGRKAPSGERDAG